MKQFSSSAGKISKITGIIPVSMELKLKGIILLENDIIISRSIRKKLCWKLSFLSIHNIRIQPVNSIPTHISLRKESIKIDKYFPTEKLDWNNLFNLNPDSGISCKEAKYLMVARRCDTKNVSGD